MPMSEPSFQPNTTKVLIVEDDLDLANVYSMKFEKEGYAVQVAQDGDEGLTTIKEWHPDIILLDIMLPKKDGFEILTAIKADPETKNIPVIMWTNLSDTEEARKAKELGADDYLVKVFNMPAEVVEKVKEKLSGM